MIVKILRDCRSTGVMKGEIYKAKPYHLDPGCKVELIARETDGFDPCCTAYRSEVEVVANKN